MEKWFGHIKGLGLSAEHGEYIKYPCQKWTCYNKQGKLNILNEIIEEFENNEGILMKIKNSSIDFNFNKYSGDIKIVKEKARTIIRASLDLSFETFENDNSIEFLFSNRNKGDIVAIVVCSA